MPLGSKLPLRTDGPSPATGCQRGGGIVGGSGVVKEAVEGRARAADGRAKCPELGELRGEWRRGEVVSRERSEVVRCEGCEELGTAFPEAVGGTGVVEGGVDAGRRLLLVTVGKEEHAGVVLGQVERLERRAVAGAELRGVSEGRTCARPQ